MKVVFKYISIKNFLSIGNEPVVIYFQPGLHLITGVNRDKEDRRNGCGKSTISDAVNFGIFGTTVRELNKEFIINYFTRANCEVIIEFTVIINDVQTEYKIIRSLEPSRCELFINGEDKTRDSIQNTTDYITQILHASPEVFENCVLMSVNSTIPFMAKKKVEKRKFIESVFNLEVFSNMLYLLKDEHNERRREFDINSGKYEEINSSLVTFKKQQESFTNDRNSRIIKLNNRKRGNLIQIEELKNKIIACNEYERQRVKDQITNLQGKSTLCDNSISNVEKAINQNVTTIQFKSNNQQKIGTTGDKCPVCLKEVTIVDQEHFTQEKNKIQLEINIIETENQKNKKSLDDLKELRNRIRISIQKQNDILNRFSLKEQENKNTQSKIDQLLIWNTEVDTELGILTKQISQLKDDSTELNTRLQEIIKNLDVIKKKLAILDTARFVVSEEGVKSSIVKRMLQLFNSKIAYYLKLLDSNAVCVFNEYFEEEIINEKGIPCSYFNFSGAERKAIDFACMFAFMDLRRLQGGVSYNINIYDELFDSSVDEKGLDLVLNILKERIEKYNECIMIISHRKESIKSITGSVICLEKQNGITRRVDYKEETN